MQNAPLVSLCSPVVARLHHLVSLTLVTIFPSPVAAATERTGAPCALVWGGPYYPVGPTPTCHHPPPPPVSPGGLFVTRGAVCYIVSAGACYIVSVWNVQADFLLPSSELPPYFPPLAPPKCTAQPPNTDCCVFMGGQLSPGSFSSSWDLPNGGRGGCKVALPGSLPL